MAHVHKKADVLVKKVANNVTCMSWDCGRQPIRTWCEHALKVNELQPQIEPKSLVVRV